MREAEEGERPQDPLITDAPQHTREEGLHRQRRNVSQITLKSAGKTVWLLTLSAGISGLLFGYDTGVISSMLVSIGSDLSDRTLTTADKSLITAITSLFALICAPSTGYFAEKYGRRFVILLANLLFILSAVLQAFAADVWLVATGRAAVGAAIGMASCATPLYITELSPAALRGRLVTIQSLFITGGQVVAYVVGWLFSHRTGGWRWMVGLGVLPAVGQLFLLALMPKTPRWLVKAGKAEAARVVLQKVYGGLSQHEVNSAVTTVLDDIQLEVVEETKLQNVSDSSTDSPFLSAAKHLFSNPGNRRALTIACMLQSLQQLCGFNSLMYFSATIFALVGFTNPIGTALTIAGTNFLFTVAAFAFIDTIGRRRILLYSIPFMILGLGLCSLSFTHIPLFGATAPTTPSSSVWPATLLASILLYVSAYAIGLGCVPWQQSELFPLGVRSLGSGLATAANWSSNFVIGISFLPMMELLGAPVTFAVYAGVCVVGWSGVWGFYPETAGLELEGIGEVLRTGWGVRRSVEMFETRKRKTSGFASVDAR